MWDKKDTILNIFMLFFVASNVLYPRNLLERLEYMRSSKPRNSFWKFHLEVI